MSNISDDTVSYLTTGTTWTGIHSGVTWASVPGTGRLRRTPDLSTA